MLGYIKGSTHLFRFKLMMLIRFSELQLYKASYCFWSPDVPAAAYEARIQLKNTKINFLGSFMF